MLPPPSWMVFGILKEKGEQQIHNLTYAKVFVKCLLMILYAKEFKYFIYFSFHVQFSSFLLPLFIFAIYISELLKTNEMNDTLNKYLETV